MTKADLGTQHTGYFQGWGMYKIWPPIVCFRCVLGGLACPPLIDRSLRRSQVKPLVGSVAGGIKYTIIGAGFHPWNASKNEARIGICWLRAALAMESRRKWQYPGEEGGLKKVIDLLAWRGIFLWGKNRNSTISSTICHISVRYRAFLSRAFSAFLMLSSGASLRWSWLTAGVLSSTSPSPWGCS